MNEVADDGDLHVAAGGFGLDQAQLVTLAVDQRDPAPAALRIAAFGFVKRIRDRVFGFALDTGRQLFAAARGAGVCPLVRRAVLSSGLYVKCR